MSLNLDKKKLIIILGVVIALFVGLVVFAKLKGNKPKENLRIVELPAEEQILQDKYGVSKQISNEITYTPYYYHKTDKKIDIVNSYDPFKIQLDCMPILTIGRSTMGDVVAAVDEANKITVDTIVEEIRAERQAALDEEYEKAKAEAEAKGKTYTKDRGVADVAGIREKYVTPYSYKVSLTKINNNNNNQKVNFLDYEASYLVDPSKNPTIYLIVYKYSIPYAQFEFSKMPNMLNFAILQEADWRLTAVEAADCSYMVDKKTGTKPVYVGDDGKCIAKSNLLMSGNIRFSGEGFAWSNTEIVMRALQLVDASLPDNSNSVTSYSWSSDDLYSYYTIKLPTNMFFSAEGGKRLYQPVMTLIATFDRHNQKCINWRIDLSLKYLTYETRLTLEKGDAKSVNIRDYKVDTVDYQKMQDAIVEWVNANNLEIDITEQGYYLVNDNGLVVGRLDTGLRNVYYDFTIEGKEYQCLEKLQDGRASYISTEDLNKAPTDETRDEYITNHSFVGTPTYLLMSKDSKGKAMALAAIDENLNAINMTESSQNYYVFSYEYSMEEGYSNIVLIDQPIYDKLSDMYITTYNLTDDEQTALLLAAEQKQAVGMKEYIQSIHNTVK